MYGACAVAPNEEAGRWPGTTVCGNGGGPRAEVVASGAASTDGRGGSDAAPYHSVETITSCSCCCQRLVPPLLGARDAPRTRAIA